jgi:eukaryotic-like serine/threonine-protein kinase
VSGWAVPGYTELKSLGGGGFGTVVLARDDATGTPVAIKYLRTDMRYDPELTELFRAEAVTLGSLDDPYVVRLYEYVESPDGAAIVMELVDGVTLRDILSRFGKTTPEAALVVLYGSLLGLVAAHARGVVHRDYKPANVLVNAYGASKLTDFGIAARTGAQTVAAGSLPYAPPEQFYGGPATAASDVYAATATFYECLTGEPPFGTEASQSQSELMEKHRAAPVPLDPIPERLRPLVTLGMAKDTGSRPADAAALAARLRAVAVEAYGADWAERGRSHLGEAALLLAALWPTGGAPSVAGFTQEQVLLARGAQRTVTQGKTATQDAPGQRLSQEQRHERHVEHVAHVEHLAHLRFLAQERDGGGAPPATGPGGSKGPRNAQKLVGRLRTASLVVAAVAVAAAVITVAATSNSGSPAGPGGSSGHPAVAGYQIPLETIPLTTASNVTPADGDVYVEYDGGNNATAQLSGTIDSAATGSVVRLYAQRFPFTSAPALAATDTLNSGGSASYTFQVTPTLATRYQARFFSSATATAPVAESAVSTVYVLATFSSPTWDCTGAPVCQTSVTYTIYQPPSTLATEMAKQWYVYVGVENGSGQAPQTLTLDPNAVIGSARQIAADAYTRTVSFSYNIGNSGGTLYKRVCFKDTEAQDGTGLPNATGCGDPTVSATGGYLG